MQLPLLRSILISALVATSLLAQAPAQPKVTRVLATLTVKPGITRDQIMKVMQDEVRQTVGLYLDGKIQEWYARGDGKGVVFLLDCKSVEEAKETLEALPLIRANFASFEYMPLGPLTPLRLLLAPPTPAQ
jgi:hypothetical protein